MIDPMTPRPFRVLKRRRESYDTVTLEIRPADGQALPSFGPGQFNMMYRFGVGEVPISMSGDPANHERWVHTLRAVGPVSGALCDLKSGEMLGIRGPYGVPWPVDQAEGKDVVLVAGGIGLAPLRPALYALLADRHRFGRIALLYGARTPADLLFPRELERWRGRFDLQVEVTVDSALGDWHGPVGVVPALLARASFDPMHTLAMMCGPEIMMRYTIRELTRMGVETDQIFLSMERNMKCAIGFCGHCQFGPTFVCKDGPVFRYDQIAWLFGTREI